LKGFVDCVTKKNAVVYFLQYKSENKTWIVEHIGNDKDSVNQWWGAIQETMKSGKMAEAQEKMQTHNLINRAFMPTTDANKIFCLWETKYKTLKLETTHRDKLRKWLDNQVTGAAFTDRCHCIINDIDLVPTGANKVDPTKVFDKSKMFIVEHRGLAQTDVLNWHATLQKNFQEKGYDNVLKAMREEQVKAGMYNHFYMQTSNNNTIFCMWEVKKSDREERDLLAFIDTNITNGAFYNIAHELDSAATDVWKVLPENKTYFQ